MNHRRPMARLSSLALITLLSACQCEPPQIVEPDAGAAQADAGYGDVVNADAEPQDLLGHDGAPSDATGFDALSADVASRDHDDVDADFLDAGGSDFGLFDANDADHDPSDTEPFDSAVLDVTGPDQALQDAASGDFGYADSGLADASAADAALLDSASIDSALQPPHGLSTPCANGPGWTLFRFHYDGSTSARIDVWDASCDDSFASGSACNVVGVTYGFGDLELVRSDTGLLIEGTDYIRVRFSAHGLDFSQAALYVQADAYSTGASTHIEAWSPLYGSEFMGPVTVDWVYDWYGCDWSDFLSPLDDPDLTAIQLYASGGAASMAVHAVELCVQ